MRFVTLLFLCVLLVITGCAHGKGGKPADLQAEARLEYSEESENDFLEDDFLEEEDEEEENYRKKDPLSFFNRPMHEINDKLYFWVLKPATKGYMAATSVGFRVAVSNFFRNLGTPIRLVNCSLQWKGRRAKKEAARFLINSTVGILGFADFAAGNYPSLAPPPKEDMGQTFGVYGLGHGFYLVIPFMGPTSLRDTIGSFGDNIFNPEPWIFTGYSSLGATGLKKVNDISFKLDFYETIKDAAVDPYEAFRDAYFQLRKKNVQE